MPFIEPLLSSKGEGTGEKTSPGEEREKFPIAEDHEPDRGESPALPDSLLPEPYDIKPEPRPYQICNFLLNFV